MHNFTTLKNRAFTLIELLVVIAIIGLLASVVLASLQSARASGRDATRVSAVKELQKALELYRNTNRGNYPCAIAAASCSIVGAGSNGAAAGAQINSSALNTFIIGATGALANFYTPSTDTLASQSYLTVPPANANTTGSIVYRVGSSAATPNNNSPVLNTYTILLRRELATAVPVSALAPTGNLPALAWCSVTVGAGHSAWTAAYPPCF
jgi:prepilin-type N-terminal cleavage/methylation domain-containing protein